MRQLALLLLCGSVVLACGPRAPRQLPRGPDVQLDLELLPNPLYAAPLVTPSGEWLQVMFRLNLYNRSRLPLRLDRVDLRSLIDGQLVRLHRLEGPQLANSLTRLPWIVIRDRQTLAAARRWASAFRQPKGDAVIAPEDGASLPQQLTLTQPDELPETLECLVRYNGTRLLRRSWPIRRYRQQTPLRLPFEGRWMVMAGHAFGEAHGRLHMLSESFAYDFAIIGDNLRTYVGDRTRPASFLAYGRAVVAAAPGTVVTTNDGVPEQDRTGQRPNLLRTLRAPSELGGNYVVLAHQGGEHSAYLHLKAGLAVKLGDVVRAGQVLGYCGNSGNSSEPHLHFQLQDGPDPLTAHGLPVRFGNFTLSFGYSEVYASTRHPIALPLRLPLQPGKRSAAIDVERFFRANGG